MDGVSMWKGFMAVKTSGVQGSSSLTLQLPMLKEVKTKTLVSRKDSAVTNNLPSNWTGDQGDGEPLGTRVFCPHLLHVMRMRGWGGELRMKSLNGRRRSFHLE
ncbi:hypothetical protein CDAR_466281 [Caerostris darwini]|uniref:Uncharacterized protein n=1 Tax=Caerostris darwini TaxID=1538125 RepID=A0AAV4WP92_9ARAC|nr:hypothetical protein CDAR_466281 [Caerostris darwini]